MSDSHVAFVPVLIAEFPRWLTYFEQHYPFTKPQQLALHQKTSELRRVHLTVSAAIADAAFVSALYDTLRAWGIGSRRSHLRPVGEFASALVAAHAAIVALEQRSIESVSLDVDATADVIWQVIKGLNVVDNNAQLVAGTKTLHHLLPDLVPPMDREYTQRFFRWHNPQFQYGQENCFKIAFAALALVARQANPRQYVGAHPWNTSATKVLDNALVGFLRAVDDGLVPGKTAQQAQAKSEPTPIASPTAPFEAVWSRITGNAGQRFATVTGLPFTYAVAHGAVRPNRANRNIPRSDFEKALARVPLKNTAGVQDLQGPSFVYAILMDDRIRAGEW